MPSCGQFEVSLANTQVELIRESADRTGIGDRRVGNYDIIGVDGSVVGQGLFEAVVAAEHEGGFRLIGNVHNIYDAGTLHFASVYQLPDLSTSSPDPAAGLLEYHVLSGTGDFAGASGSVKALPNDSGPTFIQFDLDCT
ncbi:MAG: hypothetical protein AAGF57_20055 [Pseudomonadota bacterium]